MAADCGGVRLNSTSTQTYSGLVFDYAAPTPEMISIDDIVKSLYRNWRFNAHLDRHWSIGFHSELVHYLLEGTDCQREGLFADVAETWTGDMPGPLKRMIAPVYKPIENAIDVVVAKKFDLVYPWPKAVKTADILAQNIEATMMLPGGPKPGLVTEGFVLELWHEDIVQDIWDNGGPDRFRVLAQKPAPAFRI